MTVTADTTQHTDAELYAYKQRHEFIHQLRVSVLYHQKRARFFDGCDKAASAVAVLGSTTAIIDMLGPKDGRLQVAAAGAVAVVSTAALVFGFSGRARLHSELARDFSRLLAKVHSTAGIPDLEQIAKWQAECHELQSQEPATMTAVLIACENQLHITATGKPVVTLPWTYRLFGHIIDFPPLPPDTPAQEQPAT